MLLCGHLGFVSCLSVSFASVLVFVVTFNPYDVLHVFVIVVHHSCGFAIFCVSFVFGHFVFVINL